MKTRAQLDAEALVWGSYPNYDDIARLTYGQRLWRRPGMRARLLAHWMDARHPYRERFAEHRELVESVLGSDSRSSVAGARRKRAAGKTWRLATRPHHGS